MDDQSVSDAEAIKDAEWLAYGSCLLVDEAAALLKACGGDMNTASMCITMSKNSNVNVLDIADAVMKSKL